MKELCNCQNEVDVDSEAQSHHVSIRDLYQCAVLNHSTQGPIQFVRYEVNLMDIKSCCVGDQHQHGLEPGFKSSV